MSWASTLETIRVWVRDRSGVVDSLVTWDGEPLPFTDSQPVIRLSLVSAVEAAPDRIVRKTNVAGTHDVSISSVLEATIQIRVESETHEGSGEALGVLENIRIKTKLLAHPSAEAKIVGEIGPFTRIPTLSDGRAMGVWAAELKVRALFDYADPTAGYVAERATGFGTTANPTVNVPFDSNIA